MSPITSATAAAKPAARDFRGATKSKAEKPAKKANVLHFPKGSKIGPFLEHASADRFVPTVTKTLSLSSLFGLPATHQELGRDQYRRQSALLDAIKAFTTPDTPVKETVLPDITLRPMQQQQQTGGILPMSEQERSALQQRQLAEQRRQMQLAAK